MARPKKIDETQLRALVNQGLTYDEIGAKLGIDRTIANKYCIKHGIKREQNVKKRKISIRKGDKLIQYIKTQNAREDRYRRLQVVEINTCYVRCKSDMGFYESFVIADVKAMFQDGRLRYE